MKVLIVSVSFYPEVSPRSFRTTELAKEFRRQGHEVTLAGRDREGSADVINEYGIRYVSCGNASWEGVSQWMISKGGFWRIVQGVMGWFLEFPSIEWLFVIPKRLKIAEEFDLIISIAVPYPVHWGVNRAIKKGNIKGKTWVADCSDPFMFDVLRARKIPFYFSIFEKAFCRRANFLTVPMEAAKDGYYPEFRSKMRIIPQGFHFEKERENLPEYIKNEVPTFVYAGAFMPNGRDPRALIGYLKSKQEDFRFYMYTHQKYLVEPLLDAGDKRFILKDIVPRTEIMGIMRRSDFLINIMNSTPMQLPSKLIDYYIIDRPVLNLDSDTLSEKDKRNIDLFFVGEYGNRLIFGEMLQYHIREVVKEFTALMLENK